MFKWFTRWQERRRHRAEALELEMLDWAEEWEETKQLMREAEARKQASKQDEKGAQ